MKMVKSLLLGSATGIVAVAGAQAADLPVKAKPVEYVKVCSLYGAGFYYIPGTDICLKVGGVVRAEYAYGNIGNSMTNLDNTGPDGQRTRISGPDWNQRSRAYATFDSRQQTAYGTLRTYFNVGFSYDITNARPAAGLYANRAFIQIAGFTFGTATSFYDFYSSPATSYSVPWTSDTGDSGWKVLAYTAQLGNGVSATLSLEEPRRTSVSNGSITNTFALAALPTPDQIKVRFPDLVANLRVDQAWGSAQVMGAIHDVSGGYYGTTLTGSAANGHPADKLGGAVGAGIKINTPFISPGDYLQAQVNYCVGATGYCAITPSGSASPAIFNGGTSLGWGFFSDALFSGATAATGTELQLTTAWSAHAAYEHFWTPALRTSFVVGYTNIRYNDAATAIYCSSTVTSGLVAFTNGCGPGAANWSHLSLSSRTQWNITKDFYIGLEQYYARLYTASRGNSGTYQGAAGQAQPAGLRTFEDQNVWVTRFRVHRDIVP
jgi:hypothetical protein